MNRPKRKTLSTENLVLKGVPYEYIPLTLDDYVAEDGIKEIFKKYLDNIDLMIKDRTNLFLYGDNGTGKTFLSSLVIKEAYRSRYRSEMITLQEYMGIVFKSEKSLEEREKIYNIQKAHVLVIDEVGKEQETKSGSNRTVFEELLRQTVRHHQTVIICSNLDTEDFYDRYGNSIRSLVEGDYLMLQFSASDFRKIKKKEKESFKFLMGGN